jgi:hypothetical protein
MNRSSIIRDDRANALVETALVSIVLLTMVLGIVEFGNAFSTTHTMTSLSREGANIAARGSSLDESVNVVMTNGATIALPLKGGVIGSRLVVEGGEPRIKAQVASAGYQAASRLGLVGDNGIGMDTIGLSEGQTIHVVEILYTYDEITPFGRLVNVAVPGVLYERAVF